MIKQYTAKEIHDFAFSSLKNKKFVTYEDYLVAIAEAELRGLQEAKEIMLKTLSND